MAAPLPCDSCGSPIADSDLETGNAITLLGKRYCSGCKTEAIQSVSLDELNAKPPAKPGAKAVPPAAKAAPRTAAPARPAPKASSPRPEPERKPPARRPAAAAPKAASKTPLFIGLGAVAVIAIVAAVFLLHKDSPPAETPRGAGKSGPEKAPATAGPDRDAQAREAFLKVDELVRRGGVSPDLILAAVEKAKAICSGTEWSKKLEDFRVRAAEDKKTEDASREITPLFDELKGAVAGDPEFKRFAELQPKFQSVLEMAGRTNSAKMTEIRALQADYNGRYEKLAEPYYTEINEAATQLAEERRFDDALRKINSFPQNLRNSKAWHSLDKLRKDIESRKKK